MSAAYICAAISVNFSFAVIGLLINNAIKRKAFYTSFTRFNFIPNDNVNRYLGILYFRHLLATTAWKRFNPAHAYRQARQPGIAAPEK